MQLNSMKTWITTIVSVALVALIVFLYIQENKAPRQTYNAPAATSLLTGQPTTSSTQAEFEAYIARLRMAAKATSTISFKECIATPSVARISPKGTLTLRN